MSIFLADIFRDMQDLMVIVAGPSIVLMGAILFALLLIIGIFAAFMRALDQ
jgi:hypothetical protein